MITLKQLASREEWFSSGHTLCPGCSIPVILKLVLGASRNPLVISNATGCLQMGSTLFPHTAWKSNWIHTGYGNASATMSGINAVYRSLKKKGRLMGEKERKFLVIGGDGSTYDTGLGSISGYMERGENIVYLCYDNQSMAHSGGQASSATPVGASTTTTPAGTVLPGKLHTRKNITAIIAAHRIPYVAQSAPWNWNDLLRKAEKAFETQGPAYLNVLSPCPTHWNTDTDKSIELSRLAADTCVWPMFEIRGGTKIAVNYKPRHKLPVSEWLKTQDRFKHLLEKENKWIVDKIQEEIDQNWDFLLSSQNEEETK